MSLERYIHLLRRIVKFIWPTLLIMCFINIYDAFFWEIGPLFSEQFKQVHPLNGLFMSAYSLPVLLVGWFVGSIAEKFGQKKAIFWSLLLSSAVLLSFTLLKSMPVVLFIAVLVSSTLITITTSINKGNLTDFISQTPQEEGDLEMMADVSVNIGYVVGPVGAGFIADKLGNLESFSVLGVIGIICAGVIAYSTLSSRREKLSL